MFIIMIKGLIISDAIIIWLIILSIIMLKVTNQYIQSAVFEWFNEHDCFGW